MDEKLITFLILVVGSMIVEIGGISLLIFNRRSLNPSRIKRLGILSCIMGIVVIIMGSVWFLYG